MNALGCREIVDLHHHILPGVDDGAVDLDTAVRMAEAAVAAGIATVVATPHTCDGVYDVDRTKARRALAELQRELAARQIALEVRLAGEVHLHESILARLRTEPDLTLDGQGRWLLLELPHQGPPPTFDDFLFRLLASGTTPLIAHPERNLAVRKDPRLAERWVQRGARLQLTAGSVSGDFGQPIAECAEVLLRLGCAHVLASDAHSLHKRPPLVREGFAAAAAIVGADGARTLLVDNPRRILAGASADTVIAPTALPPERRGLFGRLFR
jgi:protein-tyrosine phosphatase